MSKIDIALVMPPSWGIQFPALSISYLAAYLKKNKYRVRAFDMNTELYHSVDPQEKEWWGTDKLSWWIEPASLSRLFQRCGSCFDSYVDKILESGASVIGFSVYDSSRLFAVEIARKIKKKDPSVFIVFGGAGCCNEEKRSWMPRELVDLIVVGEGEEALARVLEHSKSGSLRDLERVNFARPFGDLNLLPFPDFSDFKLEIYADPYTLPVLTSRGCIGNCSFCNDHYLSGPYRYRDARELLAEIKHRVNVYGVKSFNFQDLTINGRIENLDLFCRLLAQEELGVSWTGQAIPYAKMTEAVLNNMRLAGCASLVFGLESASNNILKKMGKFFTRESAEKVIRDTRRAGIAVCVNLIAGFPGETEQDFGETLDFLARNSGYINMVSSLNTCCVNNDTDLDNNFSKYGLVLSDDPRTRAMYWKETSGADYPVREQRVRRITDFLKELKIPLAQNNLNDTKNT